LESCARRLGVSINHFFCTLRYVGSGGGKVLTKLVELREEVAMFLDEKSDLAKSLHDEEFIPKLTYLADIFSKLNELNFYLKERKESIYLQFTTKFKVSSKNLFCGRRTLKTASLIVLKHLKPL
jgi:hypothetical protein